MTDLALLEHVPAPTADPAWVLRVDGYDPLRESSSLKLKVDQTEHRLDATLEEGEPMTLIVGGEPNQISCAADVSLTSW